eukprot:g63767.t1
MFETETALPLYLDSAHGVPTSTRLLSGLLSSELVRWWRACAENDQDLARIVREDHTGQNQSQRHFDLKCPHVAVNSKALPGTAAAALSVLPVISEIRSFNRSTAKSRENLGPDFAIGQSGRCAQFYLNLLLPSKPTLVSMLQQAVGGAVALWAPAVGPWTYSGLLELIRGEADLRRIGVTQETNLISYVAPSGILSATAFLALAAQCPLEPAAVVIFEGVDPTPVVEAAAETGVVVHYAHATPNTCGLFSFQPVQGRSSSSWQKSADSEPLLNEGACPGLLWKSAESKPLLNEGDRPGLLLRTSGTTSVPKTVPLSLHSILSNAHILAHNIGLQATDVSLSAGASVIITPRFDPAAFLEILTGRAAALSTDATGHLWPLPKPTWFSGVPTMHEVTWLSPISYNCYLFHQLISEWYYFATRFWQVCRSSQPLVGVPNRCPSDSHLLNAGGIHPQQLDGDVRISSATHQLLPDRSRRRDRFLAHRHRCSCTSSKS